MDRILLFLAPLMILAMGEVLRPRRKLSLPRKPRWRSALMLLGVGTALSYLLLPAGLVGIALLAERLDMGILARINLPLAVEVLLGFVVFDLAVWAQHVAMHKIDLLWRFHRVHHSDPDCDVFTALRFHPGEIVISLIWKSVVIFALGIPVWAALLYAVILNISAMFNHANLALPAALDRRLRWCIVTPDMHRVHHSREGVESHSNFGFCIPWWDRLFGSYQAQPRLGHDHMQLGQADWHGVHDQTFRALLLQPRYRP